MGTIHVVAKADFLQSLSTSKPIAAIAELVWNGLDACATNVQVVIDPNELDGFEAIRVRDDGTGIKRRELDDLFGSLGDSWKSKVDRFEGRSLHGKNGKGRFKAFSLGEKVEWVTTFEEGGVRKSFRVCGDINRLNDFEATDPEVTPHATRGTEVIVSNLRSSYPSLRGENARIELTKIFAAYLTEYPGVQVFYDGEQLDPTVMQAARSDYTLEPVGLSNGQSVHASVTIIEWKAPAERVFQLCDASGVALHEIPIGPAIRAPGFDFTVYVRSDHFRELDRLNLLSLSDLHDDVQQILSRAKTKVREHFRLRQLKHRSETVDRWKTEKIYPYEDKEIISPTERVERQFFDILAVNVENHLPSFEEADKLAQKFTFRLLAQAIRDNPETLRKIFSEVLKLKKEEQDDLAGLLDRTTLSRIISAARVVADRIDFVEALNDLLFQKESRLRLLERDQLHKALENEAWLFREDFYLAGSEKRLEDALAVHLDRLGERRDDGPVLREGDTTGRIDLMLSRAIQPTAGRFEYLVVELKRPSQKITSAVLQQVESYAIAVAKDPRFHTANTKWTFMVVSTEMDEHAQLKARQKDKPHGVVFDNGDWNLTVWAKTWAEVLDDARARLKFFGEQLAYEADTDSEIAYLAKAHSKYIPEDLARLATQSAGNEQVTS